MTVESGPIVHIGEWVLGPATSRAKSWRGQRLTLLCVDLNIPVFKFVWQRGCTNGGKIFERNRVPTRGAHTDPQSLPDHGRPVFGGRPLSTKKQPSPRSILRSILTVAPESVEHPGDAHRAVSKHVRVTSQLVVVPPIDDPLRDRHLEDPALDCPGGLVAHDFVQLGDVE